ncbi:MAG: nucleoside hydrolase [Corynebacterium sp.]|nr:nucleoside hydrolase [Corynebacterium sp.]
MSKHRLIIDTDTAQDDCVAIMMGALSDRADLLGVTMVAGNVGFDLQVKNAFMTLNVCGVLHEIPVYLGATQPLMRPWRSAAEVHGDGGGGLSMDLSDCAPSTEHASDALLRHAYEEKGELSILAIGPLTNIALALAKDRNFPKLVKNLYIMGGSNNGRGNITPNAEYNFYVDPEAARMVFEAGFENIHVVTWDPITLRDATINREGYKALGSDTPLSQFFHAVCDTTMEFNESVGIDGSTHPDSITLAAMLYPEMVLESTGYHVEIETSSELTRGYASMAWAKYGLTPNATVVEKMDSDAYFGLLDSLLKRDIQPSKPIQGLV